MRNKIVKNIVRINEEKEADHECRSDSSNSNKMMSDEEYENIVKYLTEFFLSLHHALPMNFELVCDDTSKSTKPCVCPCNIKMKGWFREFSSHNLILLWNFL